MTYDEVCEEFSILRAAASRPPADIGIENPEKDPIEQYRERIQRSGGDLVWLVWLPGHPDTVLGEAGRDKPEHAIVLANTGNGPTAEANARFIAFCFDAQREIMDLMQAGLRVLNTPSHQFPDAQPSVAPKGEEEK